MDWDSLNWAALERLRANFLSNGRVASQYWQGQSDLEAYDLTFAQRIGWKWDAVLSELAARGWHPKAQTLLDWGCGTGIAARRYLEHFGPVDEVRVWDHSPRAREFARARVRAPRVTESAEGAEVLLLSHVLNELADADKKNLLALVESSRCLIWVEPGTREVSRELSRIRDGLLAAGGWRVIAPCTHGAACGMLAGANAQHWCHGFARPPAFVHHDGNWSQFSRRMGIDLRRVAYSFLVLEKGEPAAALGQRMIGEPRHEKGYAKILSCDGQRGVGEIILQKRDDPELFKRLKDPVEVPVFQWHLHGNKIQRA